MINLGQVEPRRQDDDVQAYQDFRGWFNQDLFVKGFYHARTTDEQLELLNNYWQMLWRSVRGTQAPVELMEKLDVDMENWWKFRERYQDAVFRRALDPRDIWGGGLQTSYEAELGSWKNRFLATIEAFKRSEPDIEERLAQRGVDTELGLSQFPASTDERSAVAPMVWGIGAAVVLITFGIWASSRSEGYRRSDRYEYV